MYLWSLGVCHYWGVKMPFTIKHQMRFFHYHYSSVIQTWNSCCNLSIPVFYPTVSNRLFKEKLMVNVLYDTPSHFPFSVSTQGFPTTCIFRKYNCIHNFQGNCCWSSQLLLFILKKTHNVWIDFIYHDISIISKRKKEQILQEQECFSIYFHFKMEKYFSFTLLTLVCTWLLVYNTKFDSDTIHVDMVDQGFIYM
jgi:hypothetical protein